MFLRVQRRCMTGSRRNSRKHSRIRLHNCRSHIPRRPRRLVRLSSEAHRCCPNNSSRRRRRSCKTRRTECCCCKGSRWDKRRRADRLLGHRTSRSTASRHSRRRKLRLRRRPIPYSSRLHAPPHCTTCSRSRSTRHNNAHRRSCHWRIPLCRHNFGPWPACTIRSSRRHSQTSNRHCLHKRFRRCRRRTRSSSYTRSLACRRPHHRTVRLPGWAWDSYRRRRRPRCSPPRSGRCPLALQCCTTDNLGNWPRSSRSHPRNGRLRTRLPSRKSNRWLSSDRIHRCSYIHWRHRNGYWRWPSCSSSRRRRPKRRDSPSCMPRSAAHRHRRRCTGHWRYTAGAGRTGMP